ncbi:hypothetical protein MCANUF31_01611 [Mycoplasmopsis canis UF31]|uniref:hypothetical protein n=1 Tax=Mycoplasmopsis canis TaxID=29555 RepID=UPI00025AE9E7|nr:hypothetical protein [Mycoplasmopsis canis]EIE39957.1 hypothetical protein MCANUF31_01611 [Mycoplasmopsis canis UF31]
MRKDKNNLRIARRHDISIKPEEEGMRYKRFMGDKINMENVYRPVGGSCCGGNCAANKNANLLLKHKQAVKMEKPMVIQKEVTVVKQEVVMKPAATVVKPVEKKVVQEVKPKLLDLNDLAKKFTDFFNELVK